MGQYLGESLVVYIYTNIYIEAQIVNPLLSFAISKHMGQYSGESVFRYIPIVTAQLNLNSSWE